MTALSKFRSIFRLSSASTGSKESLNTPILKLCRIYTMVAAGAALFILICIYLNSWLWKEITLNQSELLRKGFASSVHLNPFNYILNWAGLFLLVGAIFYGFKIARQANIDARNNAQLLQEAQRRAVELAALYDTSQAVSGKHDLSALLQTILERAKTLLDAAGCAIFLYDAEHDDFQIVSEVGVGMPIGTHLPLCEGLAGRVAETRQPLIVNDYKNWPYRSTSLTQLPITAVVCVPMIRGGELIGVLGVHEVGANNRMYTEADARLLSLFADNAAGAVHIARLLDDLRNSEERFRIAAECASDIVYDWDLVADHVDYFGALFEKTRTEKKSLAQTRREYWETIHPSDRDRIHDAYNQHIETGVPFSEEYRGWDGKGSYIVLSDRAIAIRNKKGKPVRLIGTVSDITERKRAEQMKSDFVSFVTHQLRTPLSGVKWMLELASDAAGNPEEILSFVKDAQISTERLIRLVNDLLDISRLERGKLQVSLKPLDLAELTQDVVGELMHLVIEKKQKLSIQPVESLPQLYADAQLLRQVVMNLISNAMKYTPSNGEIAIQIALETGRLRWSIQDTGIGIPAIDMGKLFEKFYRARNVHAVETEGTGLGLYLVRLIVERFGGKVWCESEEGAGSKFIFTLPLAAKEV
jgi:signal transduction histidine kinase/putative methionine-R-sulfoxide reductase with GAF domain